MTVAELKQALSYYADDLLVKPAQGYTLSPLITVSHGVDMDTNQLSVWLCADKGE